MMEIFPFETVYYSNEKIHFSEDHFKRLKRACRTFHIPFELSFIDFENSLKKYINKEFGGLKIIVENNNVFKIEEKEIRYSKELYKNGMKLCIAKTLRDKRNIFNYFKIQTANIFHIEHNIAIKKGYDSCIIINNERQICETVYANIFFRKGSEIYTPKISCGLLNGIIRKNIKKYMKELGFELRYEHIYINEINTFEECFITNSIAGVFPVSVIQDTSFSKREFVNLINKVSKFIRPWNI
ncbi:aminotransferase class IV [Caldicellulosiruptoraceae bacterium PP1]